MKNLLNKVFPLFFLIAILSACLPDEGNKKKKEESEKAKMDSMFMDSYDTTGSSAPPHPADAVNH